MKWIDQPGDPPSRCNDKLLDPIQTAWLDEGND